MKNFLDKLRDRQEKKRARRAARTPKQKQLLLAAFLLMCGGLLAALATSTAISTAAAAIILYAVAVQAIDRRRPKIIPNLVLLAFLILPFAALSVLVNIVEIPRHVDEIIEARAYADENPGALSIASKDFLIEVEAGKIKAAVEDAPGRSARTTRDTFAIWLQDQASYIALPSGVAMEDAQATLAVKHLIFGDRIVTLFSPEAMNEYVAESQSGDAIGGRGSLAYAPIYLMTCILDADGKAMTVTALPKPGYVELVGRSEARPLVEACEAFARDKTPPQTLPLNLDSP